MRRPDAKPLRRLILLAMCAAILYVQQQVLAFLPNVQFTTMLVIVFASVFTFKETVSLVFVHVFLVNLISFVGGGFNPLVLTPMLLAWLLVPIAYNTFLRRTKNEVALAFFALFFGFIYGWVFIPFTMLQVEVFEFWPYLLADLPFEIIMGTSGFLTVLWLFKPLHRLLRREIASIEKDGASPTESDDFS